MVLSYNKKTGEWEDRVTGLRGAAALEPGKAVVLVSDWAKESDISDSGFSEGAADALFASLVDLSADTQGKLFASPLHFIGHSRGASVNSEIIQRLGFWFPEVTSIQMTTVDPHDFPQDSLNIPLLDILNGLDNVVLYVEALLASSAPQAVAVVDKVRKGIEKVLNFADAMGIALNVPYSEFLDPNATVWSNVSFADNYFQTLASTSPWGLSGITVTPNGRPIAGADLDQDLTSTAGFTQDDWKVGPFVVGLAGTHSRVWQWYAGTADVNAAEFEQNAIFRRVADEGLRAFSALPSVPSGFVFNDEPWYTPALSDAIGEGVGLGWYYSDVGGGAAVRPDSGVEGSAIIADNTEVTPGPEPIPSVFNGTFEHGVRQSLLGRLLGEEHGRFPLSYEIPGWSFHGGEGFEIEVPLMGQILDVGGLFLTETNPAKIFKEVLSRGWELMADKIIEFAGNKVKKDEFGVPDKPKDEDTQEYKDWYETNWGENTPNAIRLEAGEKAFWLLDGMLGKLAAADLPIGPAQPLKDYITLDGKLIAPAGVQALKKYIGDAIALGAEALFPSDSDYALMMGGDEILGPVLAAALAAFPVTGWEGVVMPLLGRLAECDRITHNRLYVPDVTGLSFEVFAPFCVIPGAQFVVTFAPCELSPDLPIIERVVNLESGFFSSQSYCVSVPEEYRGQVATVSFAHVGMQGGFGVVFDILDDLNIGANISEICFLDDIRFVNSVEGVATPTLEGGETTLSLKVYPEDAGATTTVEINWGDGGALQSVVLPAGVTTGSVAHRYGDDRPSDTSEDWYTIGLRATNSACAGVVSVPVMVLNAAPKITQVEVRWPGTEVPIGVVGIREGDDVELAGSFEDAGLEDTYEVVVDWGDGESTTLDDLGALGGLSGSFVAVHRYLDDNSADLVEIRVTLRDDDTGEDVWAGSLQVSNVVPEIIDLDVEPATVIEGEAVTVTGSFRELVARDVPTRDDYEIEIDWGDGTAGMLGSGPIPVGDVGRFSDSHVYGDGDPSTGPASVVRTVTVRVRDDDGGEDSESASVVVRNAVGLSGGSDEGAGTERVGLDGSAEVIARAVGRLWERAGVDVSGLERLGAVGIYVGDLGGAVLAQTEVSESGAWTITIDQWGSGCGWFVDATPEACEEFEVGESGTLRAVSGGPAAGRMDLVTALAHELGHALGIGHASGATAATSVMLGSLPVGVRRLPAKGDLVLLRGGGDLMLAGGETADGEPVPNGDFAVGEVQDPMFGWTTRGGVTVEAGRGVLREEGSVLSGLRQILTVPEGAMRLRFVLPSVRLGAELGAPGDAFEVALLDVGSCEPVVPPAVGLSATDAFINVQSDGRVLLGPGVHVAGVNISGDVADLDEPVTVDVDLGGIEAGRVVTLYFDLLGLGALDSEVSIDDVEFVLGGNTAPKALDDEVRLDEDSSVVFDVRANDTDAQGDVLTARVLSGPTDGQLAALPDGTFRYTPAADFHGEDRFTYVVSDGALDSAPAVVRLLVAPVNDAPVAQPDSVTLIEDATVEFAVLANDSDVDGNALSLATLGAPAHGRLERLADDRVRYVPEADYFGSDRFVYTVRDSANAQATAEVLLTIEPVEDPARANDDLVPGYEDVAAQFDVLANDSDPDGDALTLISLTDPGNGEVVDLGEGWIEYRPALNFYGEDAFTYTVTDGKSERASATVRVVVRSVDDAPEVGPQLFSTPRDTRLSAHLVATDVDSEALTFALEKEPAHGQVLLAADGQFEFVPEVGFVGSDGFDFSVSDGILLTAGHADIGVQVTPHAPAARDDTVYLDEDGAAHFDVRANDSDEDGDPLTVERLSSPSHGELFVQADGSFIFRPEADFYGEDGFSYRVSDGELDSNPATVRLIVRGVQDAPVARDDAATLAEDGSVDLDVLANDRDADGDALTVTVLEGPVHGTLTEGANGHLSYRPAKDYFGADSFTYRLSDGLAQSNVARVTLSVTPVPDAPALSLIGPQLVSEGERLSLTLVATDADGDPLAFGLVSGPAGLELDPATGVLGYLAPDGPASHDITLRVTDGSGLSDEGTFRLSVVNVAPTLRVTGTEEVLAGQPYVVQLAVSDPGADTISAWTLDWGDGTIETIEGSARQAAHTYAVAGSVTILASATDDDGTFGSPPLGVRVTAGEAAARVGIPDFMRGPGQPVDVPATREGLPVVISDARNVASLSFALRYDPSKLLIQGASAHPDAPVGTVVSTLPSVEGVLAVRVVFPSAVSTAAMNIVTLTATVPADAEYGSQQVLDIADVQVNDRLAGAEDDAVHLVGYFGDTTGDRIYTKADADLLAGVLVGRMKGFAAYPGVDPRLVADITGDGRLTALDASRIQQEVTWLDTGDVRYDRPEIPPLPFEVGSATVALPDFTRGPGQPVDVPAKGKGLPVTLTDARNVRSVSFALDYDPATLMVSGAAVHPDAPVGTQVSFAFGTRSGEVVLGVRFPTPVTAAALRVVTLTAEVPAGATYGSQELLDLHDVRVNEHFAGGDDDALHLVAYLGDTTGDAQYTAADAQLLAGVVVGRESGFGAYPGVDPRRVADITGDGRITALDASRIQQEVTWLETGEARYDRLEIPPLPYAGASASLALPEFMRGPGQSVDVPAMAAGMPITLTSTGVVESVRFALAYDPALLTVTAVTASAGLPPGAEVLADLSSPGHLTVAVSSSTPLPAGTDTLVLLRARVPDSATYRALHALDLHEVAVNGGTVPTTVTDGLHLAGYFGDTDGDATYTKADADLAAGVVVGRERSFAAYPGVDPRLVADITGDGRVTALDASRIQQEATWLAGGDGRYDRPEIPPLPAGLGGGLASAAAEPASIVKPALMAGGLQSAFVQEGTATTSRVKFASEPFGAEEASAESQTGQTSAVWEVPVPLESRSLKRRVERLFQLDDLSRKMLDLTGAKGEQQARRSGRDQPLVDWAGWTVDGAHTSVAQAGKKRQGDWLQAFVTDYVALEPRANPNAGIHVTL